MRGADHPSPTQLAHEALGPLRGAIEDGDVGGPGLQERVDGRPRGTSRAEHQRGAAAWAMLGWQRLEEARDVRVVGLDRARAGIEGQRIGRTDRLGGLRGLVGDRERRLLVGDRDVDAAEAGARERADRLREALGRQGSRW
jgi:hypothetical protein